MIPAPISEDRQNFWHLADSNSEVGSISTGVNQASVISGEGIGRTRRLRQRDAPRLAGKWISAGIYQGPVQQVVGRVGEAKGELGGGWTGIGYWTGCQVEFVMVIQTVSGQLFWTVAKAAEAEPAKARMADVAEAMICMMTIGD